MLQSIIFILFWAVTLVNTSPLIDTRQPKEGQIIVQKGKEYYLLNVNNGGLFLGVPVYGGVPASHYQLYRDTCQGSGVTPHSVQELSKRGLSVVADEELLPALATRDLAARSASNKTDVDFAPAVNCFTAIGNIAGTCAGHFHQVTTYVANHWRDGDTWKAVSQHPLTGVVASGAIGLGTGYYLWGLSKKSGEVQPVTCSGALDSLRGVYTPLKEQCFNKADAQKRCVEVCDAALANSASGNKDVFELTSHYHP